MAKATNKGKKLDLIVSEISKIKKLLKTLATQQAQLASHLAKPARATSKRPKKTPARKSVANAKPPADVAKAKRPVLVKAIEGAQATNRTAS
jgi:uncharacterized membrane-anchored protein YhcB (DUF1043 family)